MPASDDQDDLPLFPDPVPTRLVIGYDLTTVLRALTNAPLKPEERDVVTHFKCRPKPPRRDFLYLNHLAERYGTARLAAGEIPYR
jgi:hypothetical protein